MARGAAFGQRPFEGQINICDWLLLRTLQGKQAPAPRCGLTRLLCTLQGQQALKTLAMSFATHDKTARKAAMQQLIKVGVSSAPGASPHPGTQAPCAGVGRRSCLGMFPNPVVLAFGR
jgi:hypothetical protein